MLQDAVATGLSSLARLNVQAAGPRATVTLARRTSVTLDRRLGIAVRKFEGHKVEEVEGAPFSLSQIDVAFASRPAAAALLWRQLCEDCWFWRLRGCSAGAPAAGFVRRPRRRRRCATRRASAPS